MCNHSSPKYMHICTQNLQNYYTHENFVPYSITAELATLLKLLSFIILSIISMLFFHRKKLFTTVHNFIHLNLSIALFLGYLVFGVGVELAAKNEVCSCSHAYKAHMYKM